MMKRLSLQLLSVAFLLLAAIPAIAQYQGIPNYIGPDAGRSFRNDINQRFSGLMPISPLIVSRPFSTLPPEQDGMLLLCNDCERTSPCTGGGAGAFAIGVRGAWSCANSALEQSLNAVGNRVTNLGLNAAIGDALSQGQSHISDLATPYSLNDNPLGGLSALNANVDTTAEHTIPNFSVANVINIDDPKWGAAGTTLGTPRSFAVTTTSGNTSGTISGGPGDFAVGQHVVLKVAGPTSTLATPAAPTVTGYTTYGTNNYGVYQVANSSLSNPACFTDKPASVPAWAASTAYAINAEVQATINGMAYGFYTTTAGTSGGSTPNWAGNFSSATNFPDTTWGGAWINGTQVSDGGATWVNFGLIGRGINTGCATSYTYKVVAIDANNGRSAPSAATTISNGPAVLSMANVNLLTWTGETNAVAWAVYGCTGASCTPTLWAVIPEQGAAASNMAWMDEGNHFGTDPVLGTAINSAATAQDLLTTISAISSTSVTLGAAPSQSISATMYHDDEPAFAAALAAAQTPNIPRAIHIPNKTYTFGQTWTLPNPTYQQLIYGDKGATLNWEGPLGGAMIYSGGLGNSRIQGLELGPLNGGNDTAGVGIDLDEVSSSGVTTGDYILHNWFTTMAIGIRTSNTDTIGNIENMTFNYNHFGLSSHATDRFLFWIYNGANSQADNWQMIGDNGSYEGTDAEFAYLRLGSALLDHWTPNSVNFWVWDCPLGYANCQDDETYLTLNNSYSEMIGKLFYDSQSNGDPPPLYMNDNAVGYASSPDSYMIEAPFRPVYIKNLHITDATSAPFKIVHNSYAAYAPMRVQGLGCGGYELQPLFGKAASPGPNITLDGDSKLCTQTANQYNAMNFQGAIGPNLAQTSQNGTSGKATCSEAIQGTAWKVVSCYLNGYAETGTAQTFTFPTAFSTTPVLLESGGSCGTYNPASTATVLTLPANASMTAETCNVTAMGQ
ncbi:MAG: hypothetical protein IVW54_13510 [Candidatus Binataceae bacterium]|nr:hypothetical protein [Candidatus Binataceae bacterium]